MELLKKIEGKQAKLGVIGLGYVGLPLAVALAKHYDVVGYDLSKNRIEELRKGHDRTREVADSEVAASECRYEIGRAHV